MTCPQGHEQLKLPNAFFRPNGKGCDICRRNSGPGHKEAKQEFHKIIEDLQWTSEDYVSSRLKIKVTCDKNHEFSVISSKFACPRI